MKKTLALILALLLTLSMLTACGKTDTNTTTEANNATEAYNATEAGAEVSELQQWGDAMKERYGGSTINVLLASHTATDGMRALINEFTALTGIKVNTRILASTEMKTMQRSNSSTRRAFSMCIWLTHSRSMNMQRPATLKVWILT